MKMQIFLCALLFFFLRSGAPFSALAQHLCHPHETLALLQFKETFHITADASYCYESYPKISSWNKSRDCCSWDGITCHEMTGHVIGLDLSCSQLEGAISPNSSLFTLSHMQKLNLAFNDFKGSQISHGFGGFTRLTHLNLSSSYFSGQIASEISHLSNLILLDLTYGYDDRDFRLGQHDFQLLLQNLTRIGVLSLNGVDISSEVPMNLSSSLSYLDLTATGVHGKLPKEVFQLPKLQILQLSINYELTGSLPQFNCSKSLLQTLDLSSAKFFGEVSNSIGCLKFIEFLDLSSNNFIGTLPESIGNLSELNSLDLSSSNFSGPLPESIGNLSELNSLYLSSSNFSGPLPESIGNLAELISLDLSSTIFSGPLPESIGNLSKLNFLDLSSTIFSGPLPESIENLAELISLNLSSANFNGPLPEFIGNLSKLNFLYLSFSNFSGPLPESIGNLSQLQYLILKNNQLHGPIPKSISKLLNLVWLDLSSNNLSGIVESNMLSNLKKLQIFYLSDNKLQGPLPLSLCKLELLQILDISNNKLSGAIPQCFGNLSRELWVLDLKNNSLQGKIALTFATYCPLTTLGLNGNLLEGPLPRSLSNCGQLEVLDVENNNISDIFPIWMENLKELQILILKSNRFFGHIGILKTKNPFEKLRVIDISSNEFIGVLPTSLLKSFRAMESMYTNESEATYMETDIGYELYYQTPIQLTIKGQEIEYTKVLTILTSIDVSNNRFSREIPSVISNHVSLKILNLSHNRFSGHIPSTLGNLSLLESLDISCNHIEGEIPSQLTRLTTLEVLNLSHNHLEGRIPGGQQFDTFSNDSYIGNLRLCGFPLTKSCEKTKAPPPFLQLIHQQEEDSDFFGGFTWKSVILGYGCGIVFGMAVGTLMFFTGKPESIVGFIEKEIYHCGLLFLSKKQVHKRFKRPTRRRHKLKHRWGAHRQSNPHA